MADTAVLRPHPQINTSTRSWARRRDFPWYAWTALLAGTSVIVGLYWDISWHQTIGRDTFWTPAHLLIQFCAVLAGFSAAYLILSATFARNHPLDEASVTIWGFRGPLGAFVMAWGGVAMITSAPFDNWWHNAYGLDVEILSPPHVLLAIGITAIVWGSILLIASEMNRAEGSSRAKLQWALLYLGSVIVVLDLILKLEYESRVLMHSAVFYFAICLGLPFALISLARAAGHRWGVTIMAAMYFGFNLLMLWILPLFPAQPKLGPVYQHVTHMVPLYFPLLLIVPAFLLDCFLPKLDRRSPWLQASLAGLIFLLALVAVQWPFADFLMSHYSRNWFFGTHYLGYFQPPDDPEVRNVFMHFEESAAQFWRTMFWALFSAVLSFRIGISWGNWLKQVKR